MEIEIKVLQMLFFTAASVGLPFAQCILDGRHDHRQCVKVLVF